NPRATEHLRLSLVDVSFSLFTHSSLLHAPALTLIHTLSLHDALPIFSTWRWLSPFRYYDLSQPLPPGGHFEARAVEVATRRERLDRKSTRLNSSHQIISYAVFCLKKKNEKQHAAVITALRTDRRLV